MSHWQRVALEAVGRYHRNLGAYSQEEAFARTLSNHPNTSNKDAVLAGKQYVMLLRCASRARRTVVKNYF